MTGSHLPPRRFQGRRRYAAAALGALLTLAACSQSAPQRQGRPPYRRTERDAKPRLSAGCQRPFRPPLGECHERLGAGRKRPE